MLARSDLMKKKRVIVITGTPGTGKSSVAELVADRIGGKLLSLNLVAAESGALYAKDTIRDSKIVRTGALRKALNKILGEAEGEVVVEGHFGELVPKAHVKIAIVLRSNPFVLRERLSKRGYPAEKVNENVEAELLDACLIAAVEAFGEDTVREVDTTTLTSDEAAEEVLLAIEGRGGLPAGSVSWVTRLESEGRLLELIR
jgi:adenylate kinase